MVKRSLRTQFVFIITSLIVIVTSLDTVVLISHEKSLLIENLFNSVGLILKISEHFINENSTSSMSDLSKKVESVVSDNSLEKIYIYDDTNNKKKYKGAIEKISDKLSMYELKDRVVFLKKYITKKNKKIMIEVRLSKKKINYRIWQIIYQSLFTLFITLTFGIFVSYFLSGIILNPLHKFIVGVKRVQKGEYPLEISVEGDNEISLLATSFNNMTEKLRQKEEDEILLHHQDKLATIGQIAAGIAHEVKNPLVSIRSLSEMLRDELKSKEEIEYVSVIVEEVDRINSVIEQLLNYSKPANKNIAVFDIKEIIENMILLTKSQARKKKISISSMYKHNRKITSCRDELSQIILNILINGINSIEKNNGKIEISTSNDENSITIEIKDNGCGMDENELENIFKPFFSSQKRSGTGLGLTIVKKLVKENGGEIRVKSQKNIGTVFTLIFPLKLD